MCIRDRPSTNQLDKVQDNAADAAPNAYPKYNDIKQGQQNANYKYDAIGNLIADASEGITNISWSVYGKIQQLTKNGSLITYSYDASGNRISKTANGKTTYYVRAVSYTHLDVYKRQGLPGQSNFYTTISGLNRSNLNKSALWDGLQVGPSTKGLGLRPQAGIYEVSGNTSAAFGTTYANPTLGAGGLPQIFVHDFSKLKLISTLQLKTP